MIQTTLVEVHVSNIHKREETHRYSKVSLVAEGSFVGWARRVIFSR
jgi:3-dehydroquinate dehydratase